MACFLVCPDRLMAPRLFELGFVEVMPGITRILEEMIGIEGEKEDILLDLMILEKCFHLEEQQ